MPGVKAVEKNVSGSTGRSVEISRPVEAVGVATPEKPPAATMPAQTAPVAAGAPATCVAGAVTPTVDLPSQKGQSEGAGLSAVNTQTGEIVSAPQTSMDVRMEIAPEVPNQGTANLPMIGKPYPKEVTAILRQRLPDDDIDIRPDSGEIYCPHTVVRRVLDDAFQLGGWNLVPIGKWEQDGDTLSRDFALVVHTDDGNRIAAIANGEGDYIRTNKRDSRGTAQEKAYSNALTRCAKHMSIAIQCWDKQYQEAWKAANSVFILDPDSAKFQYIYVKKGSPKHLKALEREKANEAARNKMAEANAAPQKALAAAKAVKAPNESGADTSTPAQRLRAAAKGAMAVPRKHEENGNTALSAAERKDLLNGTTAEIEKVAGELAQATVRNVSDVLAEASSWELSNGQMTTGVKSTAEIQTRGNNEDIRLRWALYILDNLQKKLAEHMLAAKG